MLPVVLDYLRALHDRLTTTLEAVDGQATFRRDTWHRAEGGGGESRVLRDGAVLRTGRDQLLARAWRRIALIPRARIDLSLRAPGSRRRACRS
jgi:hypothetical protein